MPSLMAALGLNVAPFKERLMEAQGLARSTGRNIQSGFGNFLKGAMPFAGAAGALTGREAAVGSRGNRAP